MKTKLSTIALAAFVTGGTAWLVTPSFEADTNGAMAEATAGVKAPFPKVVEDERAGYDGELAALERRIDHAQRLVEAAPRSWMRRIDLAQRLIQRATLTGSYDDYQTAERHLDAALDRAPYASPLHLARARLDFTLHRFDRVASSLELPERDARRNDDDELLATITAMRGSLAFERGDYERAESLLTDAIELGRSYDALSRLAHLYVKTCRFEQASETLNEAASQLPQRASRARAWVQLQHGLIGLGRGRHDEARRRYERADAIYPGWWLVEEHMAEIHALEGRDAEALATYERVVAETQSPELMGALAELVAEEEPQRSAELVRRAGRIYRERLRAFPEASYGHALDHFLELEDEPELAVELAEKNRAVRPNGSARVKLAAAYLKAGRVDEARAALAPAMESSWCTADVHATAAEIAEAAGDVTTARREAKAARAINPASIEARAELADDTSVSSQR